MDAPPTRGNSICDSADPSLRLCVDFEPPIVDRSASGAALAVVEIEPIDRDGEPAARLTPTTTMHTREAASLDLPSVLTLDMWIQPTGRPTTGQTFWMLDNNTQYGASFTADGTVRCVIGNRTADSGLAVPNDGAFHHVGCSYDGAQIRVFIDGSVAGCTNVAIAIPTTGDDGLAIGANLSGSNDSPTFTQRFVGGLDDVRVWARADVDLCAAAGRTGCRTTCE